MNAKIKYTDEPIGNVKVIADFLPKPKDLVLKDETVQINISLSKSSIEYFKEEAKKNNTHYETLIRQILDEYVSHQF